jgi:hypothetical protein
MHFREELTTQWYPGYRLGKELAEMNRVIRSTTGLSIRMVKVMFDTRETEVFVISLYDSHVYDLKVMKEVYGLRWGIETSYGHLKVLTDDGKRTRANASNF